MASGTALGTQGWAPAPHLCGGPRVVPGTFAKLHRSQPRCQPCQELPRAVLTPGPTGEPGRTGRPWAGGCGQRRAERCRQAEISLCCANAAPRCSAEAGAAPAQRPRARLGHTRARVPVPQRGRGLGLCSSFRFPFQTMAPRLMFDFISSSYQSLWDVPGLILQFINNQSQEIGCLWVIFNELGNENMAVLL